MTFDCVLCIILVWLSGILEIKEAMSEAFCLVDDFFLELAIRYKTYQNLKRCFCLFFFSVLGLVIANFVNAHLIETVTIF